MSILSNELEIQQCTDVNCVRHLHTESEVVLVTNGTLRILLCDRILELHAGEGLYFMPFEVHGYATDAHSVCTILIFPAGLVPEFLSATVNKRPTSPLFRPSSVTSALCAGLDPNASYDTLHACAALYPLCCEIVDQCHFDGNAYGYEESIVRVERYIFENIATPLTLKRVATAVGLNETYLSRLFNKAKGISFREYINMLRCSFATRLLTSLKAASFSIAEIAYECGFESIRTFNRVFLQRYGITPSQMRNQAPISFPNS